VWRTIVATPHTCDISKEKREKRGRRRKKPIEATSVVRRHHAPIHKKYLGEPL